MISIVGKARSGKTTLLEKLIPELVDRGLRIGIIKHHAHHFEMDQPGKDTWRLKKAGAQVVALSSPAGLGIIRTMQKDASLDDLVARYFFDMDLVLTEGYKNEQKPKIEVYRNTVHDTPLKGLNNELIARVSDVQDVNILCFQLDEVKRLADFLVARFIMRKQ